MLLGIMGAMPEEIDLLVRHCRVNQHTKLGIDTYHAGELKGAQVIIAFSGWGKVAAAATAATLINQFKVDTIVFTGVAGAAQSHLNIGDIVIGSGFAQHDMDASPLYAKYEIPLLKKAELPVDLSLQQQLQQAANSFVNSQLTDYIDQQLLQTFEINQPAVYSGKIASGDQFISDPDKLTRLRQDIPGLFCVDMESAAVAQVCYTHQKPFAAVRTISDKADHSAAIDFGKFIKHIANQYCYGILQSWLANVNNQ